MNAGSPSDDPDRPSIVPVEPGEIVLRAEPVSGSKSPTIQYNRPRPRPILYLPDLVPWRYVWIAFRILVLIALIWFLTRPFLIHRSERNYAQDRTRADLQSLQMALRSFETDVDRYPTQSEGLRSLMDAPSGLTNWHGPYPKVRTPRRLAASLSIRHARHSQHWQLRPLLRRPGRQTRHRRRHHQLVSSTCGGHCILIGSVTLSRVICFSTSVKTSTSNSFPMLLPARSSMVVLTINL